MLSFCALLAAVAVFMVRSQLRPMDSSSHEAGDAHRSPRTNPPRPRPTAAISPTVYASGAFLATRVFVA